MAMKVEHLPDPHLPLIPHLVPPPPPLTHTHTTSARRSTRARSPWRASPVTNAALLPLLRQRRPSSSPRCIACFLVECLLANPRHPSARGEEPLEHLHPQPSSSTPSRRPASLASHRRLAHPRISDLVSRPLPAGPGLLFLGSPPRPAASSATRRATGEEFICRHGASPPARIRHPESDPSTPAIPMPPHHAASLEFVAPPLPSSLHVVLVQAENECTLPLRVSQTTQSHTSATVD
ncbi:uncharacterized protein [Triticum aestivum]|uniref:uncharacterized protein n=1 Tax=Triticum aestivum TaxID=4565 RepID=UPI001D00E934|nr:uncharacterized protein LOC123083776 [Triticum aestivum]